MAIVHGGCLCGAVRFEIDGPVETISHCHCSRCRRAHGAAWVTWGMVPPDRFRQTAGADALSVYQSSPGFRRVFCRHCGSIVPDPQAWEGMIGVPVGLCDDDPGGRPIAHIFFASRAPWVTPHDDLPKFDGYPPGFEAPAVADPPAPPAAAAGTRGGCLCGAVGWTMDRPPAIARYCHCSRCRKARAALHAANCAATIDAVRVTHGEDRIRRYDVPGARYFAQTFCDRCSAPVPRFDPERNIAIVPLTGFDGDPGFGPDSHIFAGSRAPWDVIDDGLPQYDGLPSS